MVHAVERCVVCGELATRRVVGGYGHTVYEPDSPERGPTAPRPITVPVCIMCYIAHRKQAATDRGED